ncbi:threonine synthase [Saccharothrix algeriensis]|uniref:Pyridoxal-phosphate dependent enzyme n=1 Tax=Saccharothrix algeriensis TaxID=173560 RepID=A0A8T8HW28_9PSEU|nr:pyridoxal-phosphate dependent enzyme [Saccharothrix algeriensis]MBM7814498.1 threonine synthase [Saccharothrix algeriensis]QTR02793.1 pyridoxal-phosphate dependent enzyme [Saccharothrix algeriensis]
MQTTTDPRTPASGPTTFHLRCVRCDWRTGPRFLLRCPSCSGALEPVLDLTGAAPREHHRPELAYLDFLPVDAADLPDAALSVATPCRPAPRLGEAIGVPGLWVKDESRQPTGTTKDRFAAVVLAVFRRFGITEWVASSTGNSSTALARAVSGDATMRAHFFCGADFLGDQRFSPGERVSLTCVDGCYATASAVAVRFAGDRGLTWEGGFFNWARREGLKLTYLEAYDAMRAAGTAPGVVVQAISSGMGVVAAHKGTEEYLALGRLPARPRFLMAQQDTCAPMARAWAEGRAELTDADVVADPRGLARAILLGDGRATYPYLHGIARAGGGAIVAVPQDELVTAKAMLAELEGLDVCHSSAATVAALRAEAAAGRLDPDEVALAVLTGRDFTGPDFTGPDTTAGGSA